MMNNSEHEDHHHLHILKAVAQAWHSHSCSSRPTNEYDAHRQNFHPKPSRFKLEAMNKSLTKRIATGNWDFKQSLLDSYEIVTVAKILERGLVLDDPLFGSDDQIRVRRRRKERFSELSFPLALDIVLFQAQLLWDWSLVLTLADSL
ncbi:hypothetical protein GH714_040637 [Hevea brasiliensis]|uniref:Uncharacterized protein n=1 Tax=Hevea brasiliensis TaxID=3981 RepID=A0A6A6KZ60_HEVBR|nr:hypothetical protein GH714_040637 [Hevea brasiliensis]